MKTEFFKLTVERKQSRSWGVWRFVAEGLPDDPDTEADFSSCNYNN